MSRLAQKINLKQLTKKNGETKSSGYRKNVRKMYQAIVMRKNVPNTDLDERI